MSLHMTSRILRFQSCIKTRECSRSVSNILHRNLEVKITKFDPNENEFINNSSNSTTSKRAAFRSIAVENKLLAYLDTRNLGKEIPKKASRRKSIAIRRGLRDFHEKQEEQVGTKTFDVPVWAIKLVASAKKIEDIPPPFGLPEVAFIGRSNVGKSTLLNAVLGLKGHPLIQASTSTIPGQTRSIDFFQLGKGSKSQLILVDTPGFGFAYANKEVSEAFIDTLISYLRGRGSALKRVCMLLDARHGFKVNDIMFLKRLYGGKGLEQQNDSRNLIGPYKPPKLQIILTKCDLVLRKDLAKRVTKVRMELNDVIPRETLLPVLMVSALTDSAVSDVQKELAGLVLQPLKKEVNTDAPPKNNIKPTQSHVVENRPPRFKTKFTGSNKIQKSKQR